jgi:hypothetical protein
MLRAQDSITIKDPAEFNTYNNACGHCADPAGQPHDPSAKPSAPALESFLTAYPQSVVKAAVLDSLIDIYQSQNDPDKILSAATRLLQVDPNNLKAIYISVRVKKFQCAKTINQKTGLSSDPQSCDDAATLAQKGLSAPKPASTTADEWKKWTGTYPEFHSVIALDDIASKKDVKAGISEYRTELMLYPPELTQSGPGWQDTQLLAVCYTKPEAKDLKLAVWFFSRAWNFAPPQAKPGLEKAIEWYYILYHGKLDGLDAIKALAAATVFPPGTLVISAKATPTEIAHGLVADTRDLKVLALTDKEYILANGVKEDADKMWAVLKDQSTQVPGVVIEATDSVIKVAVTQDAKDAKLPDFIVNIKKPLLEKEIPAVGFEYKNPPGTALVGFYDSFKVVPAADPADPASAQVVLRDGEIQPEKKRPVTSAHPKPAAGHSAAHRTN